jgi:hypothetical protein
VSYFTRLDVANRALQHLGIPRIASFTDSSRQARETNFAVDKLRRAELQRSVWTFATRRCVMREVLSTGFGAVFAAYASGTTYGAGDVVKDSTGFHWISRKASERRQHAGRSEGYDPNWVPYHGPMVASGAFSIDGGQYLPGDLSSTPRAVVYLAVASGTQP